MEKLFFMLLGILIWQVIIFVIDISRTLKNKYGNDAEKLLVIGCFIPYCVFGIIAEIIVKLIMLNYKLSYSLCSIYKTEHNNDGIIEEDVIFSLFAIKNKNIDKYYKQGENEYYIKVYSDCKNIKSVPHEKINKVHENGWFDNDWVKSNLLKEKIE